MKPTAVVFVGAGFSKAFNLPLTWELWDLGLLKHREAGGRLIWDLVLQDPVLRSFQTTGNRNIEELLDHWTSRVKTLFARENFLNCGQGGYHYYLSNLCMHLESQSLAIRETHKGLWQSLGPRLWDAHFRNNLVFVTTNYDLVIERLLGENQFSYVKSDNRPVSIRKLHGSTNWMPIMKSHVCPGYEAIGTVGASVERLDEYRVIDNRLTPYAWSNAILPPVIIPPHPRKEYGGVFTQQMNDAEEFLQKADRVMFVGYSFPEADEKLWELVENSLKKSKAEVTCINPDARSLAKAEKVCKGRTFTPKEKVWDVEDFREFLGLRR